MQPMHIPEQNDQRATSVWCPCVAFRNRGASGGVLILHREVSRGHDALADLAAHRGSFTIICRYDDDGRVSHSVASDLLTCRGTPGRSEAV